MLLPLLLQQLLLPLRLLLLLPLRLLLLQQLLLPLRLLLLLLLPNNRRINKTPFTNSLL